MFEMHLNHISQTCQVSKILIRASTVDATPENIEIDFHAINVFGECYGPFCEKLSRVVFSRCKSEYSILY